MTTNQEVSVRNVVGKAIVEEVRDVAIRSVRNSLRGEWRDEASRKLQAVLEKLEPEQKRAVNRLCVDIIDTVLHDLLFMIESHEEFDVSVRMESRLTSIRPGPCDLQGALFGDAGWIAKFSKEKRSSFG